MFGTPVVDYSCKIKVPAFFDIKFCELQYASYDQSYGQVATFKLNEDIFQVRIIEFLAKIWGRDRLWSVVKRACGVLKPCERAVQSLESARISYRTYVIAPYVRRSGRVICEKTDSFTWIDGRQITNREYFNCGSTLQSKGGFFGRN
jgi:hypothetical protein